MCVLVYTVVIGYIFLNSNTFHLMESCFQTGNMAKYAFVYMAQSLTEGVPSFCLVCLGTDNKFSGDVLLKRWRYISSECEKRRIKVISFAADGDSRELKAMWLAMQLYQPIKPVTRGLDLPIMSIPPSWKSWFIVEKPTAVACIQDPVHLTVKPKSRLMKPSIILPLGR